MYLLISIVIFIVVAWLYFHQKGVKIINEVTFRKQQRDLHECYHPSSDFCSRHNDRDVGYMYHADFEKMTVQHYHRAGTWCDYETYEIAKTSEGFKIKLLEHYSGDGATVTEGYGEANGEYYVKDGYIQSDFIRKENAANRVILYREEDFKGKMEWHKPEPELDSFLNVSYDKLMAYLCGKGK
ncbi:MAG: hypothetical protein WCQ53_05825 [bacterium]